MKSLKFLLCLGLAAVAAQSTFAAGKLPLAEWPKSYSVEMNMAAGGMTTASKMFVDGDKQRVEMNAGGMDMISITRKDQKKIYSLMPAMKMVTETALPDMPAAAATAAGPEPVVEKLGSSTVNGVACTEYKVTTGADVTTWFLSGEGFPVRMVAASSTTDWKNFKAGAQDAALFEVPAGYSAQGQAASSSADNTSSSSSNSDAAAAPAAEEKPAKKKGKLGGMLGR